MVASFLVPRKAFAAEHIMICELYQGKHAMIPVRFLESLLLNYRKFEDIVVTLKMTVSGVDVSLLVGVEEETE